MRCHLYSTQCTLPLAPNADELVPRPPYSTGTIRPHQSILWGWHSMETQVADTLAHTETAGVVWQSASGKFGHILPRAISVPNLPGCYTRMYKGTSPAPGSLIQPDYWLLDDTWKWSLPQILHETAPEIEVLDHQLSLWGCQRNGTRVGTRFRLVWRQVVGSISNEK